jgi:beta-lactamase class D
MRGLSQPYFTYDQRQLKFPSHYQRKTDPIINLLQDVIHQELETMTGNKICQTFILMPMIIMALAAISHSETFPIPETTVQPAFADRKGTLVIIDCSTEAISTYHPEASTEKLPACSTFKIWNTLIGLESGIISYPDDSFYKWDGEARFIPEWNKDLTLKEAFQVSCVPAFQNLARKIGLEQMRIWIDKIGYGDRDVSSGVDVFWLPKPGRKTILISPEEQAILICKLVRGKLAFSKKAQAVLKEIMVVRKTDHGTLYGKTGSGADETGKFYLGWFVGYVESNGKIYAFACAIKGETLTGKDARIIVNTILENHGYL